ncbi:MAG: hypothetical protein FWD97_00690 [Defluviitaleaceae bacterium]|nr:hypothetical protein [Defluviitaleaceae bacterium]
MIEKNLFDVKLTLELPNYSLYELGYILVDLNQLFVFCDLLEEGYVGLAVDKFHNQYLSRRSKLLQEKGSRYEITSISNGSIIMQITGLGSLAVIVLRLILDCVKESNKLRGEIIKFNIEVDEEKYHELKRIIDEVKEYEAEFNMEILISILVSKGFLIRAYDHDLYKIEGIFERYAKRIESVMHIPRYKKRSHTSQRRG